MPNNSRTQMALARDPNFRIQVAAQLAKVASFVLDESAETEHHAERAQFARLVNGNLEQYAAQIVGPLVMRQGIYAFNTSYDFTLGTLGAVVTAAGDADIEAQLKADWNDLAGVVS